jgi:hypothetical protein
MTTARNAAEPRLAAYLTEVAARLHGPRHRRAQILAELHDGLDDAVADHVRDGLAPEEAADAALGGFGTPAEVAAAFAGELAVAYARRTLAWFLVTGPLVGIWWLLLLQPQPWRTGVVALLARNRPRKEHGCDAHARRNGRRRHRRGHPCRLAHRLPRRPDRLRDRDHHRGGGSGRLREVLAWATRLAPGLRPDEATFLIRIGDTYEAAGNPGAARDAWQQALAVLETLDHPEAETVCAKLDRPTQALTR